MKVGSHNLFRKSYSNAFEEGMMLVVPKMQLSQLNRYKFIYCRLAAPNLAGHCLLLRDVLPVFRGLKRKYIQSVHQLFHSQPV